MTVGMPKRRAWFQLHLSTCVVLMVVAGALVWANTRPLPHWLPLRDASARGWPLEFMTPVLDQTSSGAWAGIIQGWSIGNLLGDLGVAFAILTLTAVSCEFAIRRRKRTSPFPP